MAIPTQINMVSARAMCAGPFQLSLMQHTFFGLLTAILALKRPYLTLDLWV
jgi:hypothetical protein